MRRPAGGSLGLMRMTSFVGKDMFNLTLHRKLVHFASSCGRSSSMQTCHIHGQFEIPIMGISA